MHYGEIKTNDIANGEGIRTSLFVSGCRNHCKDCFNKQTWDFLFGKEFDEETISYILKTLESNYISGLTILGGEPFEKENQEALLPFIKKVKEKHPNKTIWMYTGYILDKDILPNEGKANTPYTLEILRNIDVLVDGPFITELKKITLNFRGSSNQRIIDMKKTLANNEIILSPLNN